MTRLRTTRSTRRTSASARHGWSGACTSSRTVALLGQRPGRVDDPVGDVDQVDVVGLEDGGTGVEAADLEQVDQQRLEPVELQLQQLGGAGGRRVEVAPRVVQHVAGHPHGGQRGAQLVGDVGDEPALHPAQLLELADLALQVRGHLVERRREPGQVVLAGDAQPLLQPAGGQPLGDPAGHPHRRDHLPGDQPADAGDEHQQQAARGEQRPGDQPHRVLLLVEREQEVDRVGAAVGRQLHLRADRDARLAADHVVVVVGAGDRGVGPRRGGARLLEVLLERHRDAAGQKWPLDSVPPSAIRTPSPAGPATTTPYPRVVPRSMIRSIRSLPLHRRVGVLPGRGLEPAVGLLHLVGDLAGDRLDALVEQAVAGLLEQQPADRGDDDRREDDGAGHDPGLDRTAPERQPAAEGPGESARRAGAEHGSVRPTPSRPCSRRRGPSPRSPGSRGRARPSSAAAARAR